MNRGGGLTIDRRGERSGSRRWRPMGPPRSDEELRAFQLHLTKNGAQPPSINATVTAPRFFFKVSLDRPETTRHLVFVYEPRKLPRVLSPEEVSRLLEAAPGPKHKAALSVAYGAGLRAMEVVALKICDIDSKRMMLRVDQGKGRKDRHAMLSAARPNMGPTSHSTPPASPGASRIVPLGRHPKPFTHSGIISSSDHVMGSRIALLMFCLLLLPIKANGQSVAILGTANPASRKRTEAGLYAIKGTPKKAEI
jgi:Phage integrase family